MKLSPEIGQKLSSIVNSMEKLIEEQRVETIELIESASAIIEKACDIRFCICCCCFGQAFAHLNTTNTNATLKVRKEIELDQQVATLAKLNDRSAVMKAPLNCTAQCAFPVSSRQTL